jgi:anaerobic selenocysteine-containing dehydrogenase
MLAKGSGLELADLQADGLPHVLPRPEPGTFFDAQVHTTDGLVDCCPPGFAGAIDRCHRLYEETRQEVSSGRLRLIHRRDAWMHNSWFANVARMKRGGRTTNPLSMHPVDAERLGLDDGDQVLVASDHGEVATVVERDGALMPGVVSMVHGWGHAISPRLRVAHQHPGANPNELLPIGEGSFEPLSSQAHMTGIAVDVRRLSDAEPVAKV